MPVFEDWINEPTAIINNLFDQDKSVFDSKVSEYFSGRLTTEKNYFSIPCLNEVPIHEIKPNSLVRFRCMIQDSLNPEYFSAIQRWKHTCTNEIKVVSLKYRDSISLPVDFELLNENSSDEYLVNGTFSRSTEYANLAQRQTLYCVPIPGEADWVKENFKYNSLSYSYSFPKSSSYAERPSKRPIDYTENEEPKGEELMDTHKEIIESRKKNRLESNREENSKTSSKTIDLNHPLKNENGISCYVQVYDNIDQYKINEIIEFIGILSTDLPHSGEADKQISSHLDATDTNAQMEVDADMTASTAGLLPASLVPRLHCIKAYQLKHNNPLLDLPFIKTDNNSNSYYGTQLESLIKDLNESDMNESERRPQSGDLCSFINLRNDMVKFLQEYFLFGDELAAEYLLMNLISTVFARKDVTILGKFALNISNWPASLKDSENENGASYSNTFFRYLKELMLNSHLFHLTVNSLNKSNLIPNKDYHNDKLISSMLQLPEYFQLIIDETGLNTGELNQKGLMNLNALSNIIRWQKMSYDFGFHSQDFHTNIRMLVISETKSILPYDCHVKLQKPVDIRLENYETNLAKFYSANTAFLNNLRKYITIVSQLDYKLNEHIQKIAEEDFVKMRQTPVQGQTEKFGIDDFHLLLVIARLQCLSYGKNELSLNEWNKAKCLEKERRSR